jgi:hypothetical protein
LLKTLLVLRLPRDFSEGSRNTRNEGLNWIFVDLKLFRPTPIYQTQDNEQQQVKITHKNLYWFTANKATPIHSMSEFALTSST